MWSAVCVCPNHILYPYSIWHGKLPMDNGEILVVLLRQLLLFSLLHILWDDDCCHHPKPTSSFHLCCCFLFTIQSFLRLLHPKTCKFFSVYNPPYIYIYIVYIVLKRYVIHSLHNLFMWKSFQRIPKWWLWYYWICPVAWTVYGLIVSQYGDINDTIQVPGMSPDPTVKWYIEHHFGYNPDFMGVVAAVLIGFTLFFAFMFAYCIKTLNFQMR